VGDRPSICALITSFNEERNIAECIETLTWCDEVFVVDSFSTDRTAEIARGYDEVRLVQHEYFNAAAQKNWAIDRIDKDWILIFDCDERCTPALRDEILELLRSPSANAFTIRRETYFLGKRIRFCGWHNDRVGRLFRRGQARYPRKQVHAQLQTNGPAPMLRSSMLHYVVQDIDEYMGRIRRYGTWGATQAWRDGKRAGLAHVLIRPLWRFLRAYVFQLGFLDGMPGLVFCFLQGVGTGLKWSTVWGWGLMEARGEGPDLAADDEDERIWRGLDAGA
jgi:glycosyltransferase involved in cell wall biosynthesis